MVLGHNPGFEDSGRLLTAGGIWGALEAARRTDAHRDPWR